MKIHKFPKSRY